MPYGTCAPPASPPMLGALSCAAPPKTAWPMGSPTAPATTAPDQSAGSAPIARCSSSSRGIASARTSGGGAGYAVAAGTTTAPTAVAIGGCGCGRGRVPMRTGTSSCGSVTQHGVLLVT